VTMAPHHLQYQMSTLEKITFQRREVDPLKETEGFISSVLQNQQHQKSQGKNNSYKEDLTQWAGMASPARQRVPSKTARMIIVVARL